MRIRIKAVGENAVVPQYMSEGASGFDLRAGISGQVTVPPFKSVLIPTGLAFELPKGYEMQIRSRSGLALNFGIAVLNSPGTVDSDYRGEVKVILFNFSDSPFTVKKGDRIAQAVVCKVERCEFSVCQELSETLRQDGGFGSTAL